MLLPREQIIKLKLRAIERDCTMAAMVRPLIEALTRDHPPHAPEDPRAGRVHAARAKLAGLEPLDPAEGAREEEEET